MAEGLLAHRGLLRLPPGYFGVRSILLTLAFLLLLRVQRAERLGYEQPGEWGQLLGDRCPCPRTLRRRLRQRTRRRWRPGAERWRRAGEQDADAGQGQLKVEKVTFRSVGRWSSSSSHVTNRSRFLQNRYRRRILK